jgi:two-component system response regulator YesN
MKHILLVDDEPLARKHIKDMFPWQDWGYRIVGEASNGDEALAMCEALQPHIALIDITMPVMDGLTLLKELRTRFPQIRNIMLTAHRDFDYAQQAIQYGAFGYIVKSPIDPEATKLALDRASSDWDKDTAMIHHAELHHKLIQNYQYPLRKQFFEQILSTLLQQTLEIKNRSQELGINFAAPFFTLWVCQVDDLVTFEQNYQEKDKPLIDFSLLEIVRETMHECTKGRFELFPRQFGSFVVLLHFDHAHSFSQADQLEMAGKMTKPLQQFMSIELVLAISPVFSNISLLNKLFKETETKLAYRFYQDKPHPIFTETEIPFQQLPAKDWGMLEEQFEIIRTDTNPEAWRQWCDTTADIMLTYRPEPNTLKAWITGLLERVPEWRRTIQHTDQEISLKRMMNAIHDAAVQKYLLTQNKHMRPEISAAIEFIRRNLDQDLTLDMIAKAIQLSPSHLVHVFKKDVGTTVIDYILQQRIRLAKEYLLSGQYRNFELADKTGFNSYSYFCTIFKKYTGLTPNQYKNSARPDGIV